MKKCIDFIKTNYIVVITFVFVLIVSSFVPLMGDDWGNIQENNSIKNYINIAINSFKTYEGRFFSRITDLIFVNNQFLWNIFNAIMISSLVYFVIKIIIPENKNNKIIPLLVFLGVFLVDKEVSNQVYFWTVGNATYFVPMIYGIFLLFIYNKVFNGADYKSYWQYLLTLPSFIFSMFVENVSVGIITINLVLIVIFYIKNKKINIPLIVSTLSSVLGTILMMTSPGTRLRMDTIGSFYELNLLGKINYNIPNLIEYTFIKNPFIIILLTISLVTICKRSIKNKLFKYFEYAFVTVVPIFTLICYNVSYITWVDLFLLHGSKILTKLYWIAYVINYIFIIFKYYKYDNKIKVICYMIIAMSSNGAMLLSPIWGGRTALFTTIMLLIHLLIIVNELDVKCLSSKFLITFYKAAMITTCLIYSSFYAYVSYLNNIRHNYINEQLKQDKACIEIIALPGRFLLASNLETEWHEMIFRQVFGIDSNKEIELININEVENKK